MNMTRSNNSLANIAMFSQLSDDELDTLGSRASHQSFNKSRILIKEGEKSDSLYVIVSGLLQAYLSDDNGKEVILNTMGPGEYFGEIALVDDSPRSASIKVIEDCELYIISRKTFEDFLKSHPELALTMLKGMARRLVALTKNVKSLALLDVYGRTAHFLLEAAREVDGELITEKLTQQDIANRVGCSREMISRIMKDLTFGGYIKIEKKQITLLKALPEQW